MPGGANRKAASRSLWTAVGIWAIWNAITVNLVHFLFTTTTAKRLIPKVKIMASGRT
jgi:hypothetical protein